LPNHRVIVATGFRIIGLATALPSSLMAITMGIAACKAAPAVAQQRPDYLSVTQYGLVGLLANAASGAGEVLSLLNGLAAAILGLIAVLALIAALCGVLLYVVGRGLRVSAPWARFMAAVIMVVVLLSSPPALCVLEGAARLSGFVAPILSIYVLWVLKARYAD
jgi:Zn-dependent protease with chaperone function